MYKHTHGSPEATFTAWGAMDHSGVEKFKACPHKKEVLILMMRLTVKGIIFLSILSPYLPLSLYPFSLSTLQRHI